jgi:putative membrane protein
MKRHSNLIVMAGCALLVLAADAQPKTANRMTMDNGFMTKAARGGLAEVELGRLAATHASNQQVKQFGQRMVDDHSKANNELQEIAAKEGVTLPTALDARDNAEKDKLTSLNGPDFDKAYMEDMVKDHRADIAEFKKEASSGTDPSLKAFASKTLPTLQEHLTLAESAEKEIKK